GAALEQGRAARSGERLAQQQQSVQARRQLLRQARVAGQEGVPIDRLPAAQRLLELPNGLDQTGVIGPGRLRERGEGDRTGRLERFQGDSPSSRRKRASPRTQSFSTLSTVRPRRWATWATLSPSR